MIQLETVTRLLDLTYNSGPSLIARSPSGSYFLWDNPIKEYGPDGRLARQVGRRGGGPGEYELPRNLFVSADGALHVLDVQLARYTIFNPDGTVRSTRSTPFLRGVGWPAVLTKSGEVIVNGVFMTAADAGYALQRISRSGVTTGRLDEGSFHNRKPWLQRRTLLLRSNGELLVGHPYTFAIDVYGPDLVKRRTVVRRERWVPHEPPGHEPAGGVFDKPYEPVLDAMWEDENGLLWLVRSMPSPAWKPHPAPKRGQIPSNYDDLTKRPRREMIVEVIDLSRNKLVAQTRFPRDIGTPFGAGYNAENIYDGTGEPFVRITRFRLKH